MTYEKFLVKHQETNKTYRCSIEPDGHYFIYAPNRRKYGYRYTKEKFEKLYTIVPKRLTKTEEWHNNIAKVIKKLNASGLWQDLIPFFENLMQLSYEEHEYLCYLSHGETDKAIQTFQNKYPFLFCQNKDVKTIIDYEYTSELSQCKLKSMYFGKTLNSRIKSEIKHAITQKESYYSPRIRVSYDVTFEYNAEKQKAWYCEEYKNCGNGHYYLALDENTALFCEDD